MDISKNGILSSDSSLQRNWINIDGDDDDVNSYILRTSLNALSAQI